MDARERLRRYLEQRRELGERELVLDSLSVEDVLRVLGAAGRAGAAPAGSERPARSSGVDDRGRHASTEPPNIPDPAGASDSPPPLGADWRRALRDSGVEPPPSPAPATRPAGELPESEQGAEPAAPPARGEPGPPGIVVGAAARGLFAGPLASLETLDELAGEVARCTRCPLYASALHAVPGEGNPNAQLVCVGEAPGATEDETGRPFVGQAGQLLTKILAAINLRRDEVFICNVLKHRPPANRDPHPQEVAACSPYLVRQLELIRPAVVLAFGTFAAQTLLETKLPIAKLRGAVHRYHGVPLIVTYHPAALLRNPAWKRPTWEDVQLARRLLDRTSVSD